MKTVLSPLTLGIALITLPWYLSRDLSWRGDQHRGAGVQHARRCAAGSSGSSAAEPIDERPRVSRLPFGTAVRLGSPLSCAASSGDAA